MAHEISKCVVNPDGSISSWGYSDFTATLGPNQIQVEMRPGESPPGPIGELRVFDGRFVLASEFDRLPFLKQERIKEIDRRSAEIILDGFEYPPASGKKLSMSPSAQLNYVGLMVVRDDPAIYPIDMNFADDSGYFTCEDSAALTGIFYSAMIHKRTAIDSGTELKKRVRGATSIAELDAVVDPR